MENFGKYTLLKRLAIGGMAEVYLASPAADPDKRLVIKRILPNLAEDLHFVEMFLNEARIASQLDHQNIVQLFDLGKEGASFFLSMEYIHGQDLGSVIRALKKIGRLLPISTVLKIIADACLGLQYAHTKKDIHGQPLKLVHRDISPQNLMLSFRGGLKILDFGIARAANQASTTRTGEIKGKYSYISPEQARGLDLDARSDIFSLGIVLYELLTGFSPLKRENELITLRAAIDCSIPPPSLKSPVPEEIEAIVMKALCKDREGRYASAEEFRQDIFSVAGENAPASQEIMATTLQMLFFERFCSEGLDGAGADFEFDIPSKNLLEKVLNFQSWRKPYPEDHFRAALTGEWNISGISESDRQANIKTNPFSGSIASEKTKFLSLEKNEEKTSEIDEEEQTSPSTGKAAGGQRLAPPLPQAPLPLSSERDNRLFSLKKSSADAGADDDEDENEENTQITEPFASSPLHLPPPVPPVPDDKIPGRPRILSRHLKNPFRLKKAQGSEMIREPAVLPSAADSDFDLRDAASKAKPPLPDQEIFETPPGASTTDIEQPLPQKNSEKEISEVSGACAPLSPCAPQVVQQDNPLPDLPFASLQEDLLPPKKQSISPAFSNPSDADVPFFLPSQSSSAAPALLSSARETPEFPSAAGENSEFSLKEKDTEPPTPADSPALHEELSLDVRGEADVPVKNSLPCSSDAKKVCSENDIPEISESQVVDISELIDDTEDLTDAEEVDDDDVRELSVSDFLPMESDVGELPADISPQSPQSEAAILPEREAFGSAPAAADVPFSLPRVSKDSHGTLLLDDEEENTSTTAPGRPKSIKKHISSRIQQEAPSDPASLTLIDLPANGLEPDFCAAQDGLSSGMPDVAESRGTGGKKIRREKKNGVAQDRISENLYLPDPDEETSNVDSSDLLNSSDGHPLRGSESVGGKQSHDISPEGDFTERNFSRRSSGKKQATGERQWRGAERSGSAQKDGSRSSQAETGEWSFPLKRKGSSGEKASRNHRSENSAKTGFISRLLRLKDETAYSKIRMKADQLYDELDSFRKQKGIDQDMLVIFGLFGVFLFFFVLLLIFI